MLVYPRTSQRPQSCSKYTSQETWAVQVGHNKAYDGQGSMLHTLIIQDIVIYIHKCLYTITHLSLVYDYSYIRLVELWGCLASANFRLEWQSHSTRISIKLQEQLSTAYDETGTLHLLYRMQEWYHWRHGAVSKNNHWSQAISQELYRLRTEAVL